MTATEQLFFLTAEGIHTPYGLLDINKALEMLDEGCFDEPIWHGLEIVCCISEAEEKGMTGELARKRQSCTGAGFIPPCSSLNSSPETAGPKCLTRMAVQTRAPCTEATTVA